MEWRGREGGGRVGGWGGGLSAATMAALFKVFLAERLYLKGLPKDGSHLACRSGGGSGGLQRQRKTSSTEEIAMATGQGLSEGTRGEMERWSLSLSL